MARSTMSPTTACWLRRRRPPATAYAGGVCVPDQPTGTTTEYEEGIDHRPDETQWRLLAPASAMATAGINSHRSRPNCRAIPSTAAPGVSLELRPHQHDFRRDSRRRRIHRVVRQASGVFVGVRSRGQWPTNVDDYYSPEINSNVVALTGRDDAAGMAAAPVPDSFRRSHGLDQQLQEHPVLRHAQGQRHTQLRSKARLTQASTAHGARRSSA